MYDRARKWAAQGDCSENTASQLFMQSLHVKEKSNSTQTYFSNSSFFNTLSPFGPAGPTPPGRPGTPCGNNTGQEEE